MTYSISTFLDNRREHGLLYALGQDARETLKDIAVMGLAGLVLAACQQEKLPVKKQEPAPPKPNPTKKIAKAKKPVKPKAEEPVCTETRKRGRKTKTCITKRNGKPVAIHILEYNRSGGLIRETTDSNYDGNPEEVIEYDGSHSATPRIKTETEDRNSDGKPDRVFKYVDIIKRNYILESIERRDQDLDGKMEYSARKIFIPAKLKSTEIIDKDGDGKTDAYIDILYDKKMRILVRTWDDDADRKPDRRQRWTYDKPKAGAKK
jgi:hypothetical protein